jgi:S1-C subfamily serine protease
VRPLSGAAIAVLSLCLVAPQTWAQKAEDVYAAYKNITTEQANENPLIGIWSGSLCTKRILLAIVLNNEQNGFKLKAVLLNGNEVGYGFKNADTWFYVSPMAVEAVYEGKTLYRNRLFKNWYPNRVVMTSENVFSATDDARNSCGPPTNVYVRREPRPHSPTDALAKSGSGFLLSETSFVMTAYHVVEGASQIDVRFPSGAKYKAEVAARDIGNDLAILKLVEFKATEDGFRMSVNTSLSAGDAVHALGFPLTNILGEQPSIVSGEISATTGFDDSPTQFRMTAAVNPGNSGGPILNQNGEVVGIVVGTLTRKSVEGVKFGIKASTALPLLQQVGFTKLDSKRENKQMTASQLFAAFAKYVVLVNASGK